MVQKMMDMQNTTMNEVFKQLADSKKIAEEQREREKRERDSWRRDMERAQTSMRQGLERTAQNQESKQKLSRQRLRTTANSSWQPNTDISKEWRCSSSRSNYCNSHHLHHHRYGQDQKFGL